MTNTGGGGQKALPLIVARELAANIATPMFLIDASGTIVFFNDAATPLVGRPFAELGEISMEEFGERLELHDREGAPIRRRDTPPGIAFYQHKPAHRVLQITALDGSPRTVEISAVPLLGAADELVGVAAMFWESEAGR